MSSRTKSVAPLILTKLHSNILLHLCDFLDATSLLNFSLTCKKYHQLINKNELYWRLRYYKEFALDKDWREGAWLSECSDQPAPKQPTSRPRTLEQKATRDWSHIHWRKAYYQRHMFVRQLIEGTWHEHYCDLPVDPETASLYIMGMRAWVTLIGETNGKRMWIVRHDIASLGSGSKQLAWSELKIPKDIIGKIIEARDSIITTNFIFMTYALRPIDESDDDESDDYDDYDDDDDDQYSLDGPYRDGVIIAWDIRDVNRVITLSLPQNDGTMDVYLPELVNSCNDWVLCFAELAVDRWPNDTGRRYFICDLKRGSYYPFGPVYDASSAYFHAATEDYAQVIVLYFNLDDMVVGNENPAMADDKPVGLRVHWHSHIFDDEHNGSLKVHGGEIIMPYYYKPMVYGRGYGPGLMLVILYSTKDPEFYGDSTEPHATLALVRVPDYSLPQNTISRYHRSDRNDAIDEVIWIQPIASSYVQPLCSQNLIVVLQKGRFDMLSGTDGKIVRQFDFNYYSIPAPIIGPYCYLRDSYGDSFIINMETKETFQHSMELEPPRLVVGPAQDLSDPELASWPLGASVTPNGWPFYNCIGQLALYEPRERNRFYLYSLSAF